MKPNLTNECHLERDFIAEFCGKEFRNIQPVEKKGAVVPQKALLQSVERHSGFLLVNMSN